MFYITSPHWSTPRANIYEASVMGQGGTLILYFFHIGINFAENLGNLSKVIKVTPGFQQRVETTFVFPSDIYQNVDVFSLMKR